MQNKNNHAIIRSSPPAGYIPLVGPSGRLLAYIDPKNLLIEFKRKNEPAETVDLKPYLEVKQ